MLSTDLAQVIQVENANYYDKPYNLWFGFNGSCYKKLFFLQIVIKIWQPHS